MKTKDPKQLILSTDPQDKLPCGCGVECLSVRKDELCYEISGSMLENNFLPFISNFVWQCRNHSGQEIVRSRRLI